ncbi:MULTISPECIES: carbohydrate ABC transporter permease [Paenibacillus]|uniref:carbohydrate ABC transporter permease n=1 Tax=Paenibacillus TaxID=44249 RepID=UPI0022B863BF|nr:sugar ABC transporter permease [Paenibacillus caseinilyticus]MCZ8520452.1 sugar ABC transporter permease [Paenibacillus caseinilyticus]
MHKTLNKPLAYAFFIVPTLLLYAVFYIVPLSSILRYGFTEWDGLTTPVFNGLDNFTRAFQDEAFLGALANNLVFTGFAVFIQIPLIILLAVLISEVRRGQSFYKTTFFLPSILSTPVTGVLWSFVVFHPDIGVLNYALRAAGLDHLAVAWLAEEKTALLSILITNAWHGVGFYVVLVLAAIYGIAQEIYEAAELDGTSRIQRAWHITVPLIRPIISVIVLLSIAGSLKTLDIVMVMTNGGPAGLTEVMATYMYKVGFQFMEAGYANTLGILIFLFIVILTLISGVVTNKLKDVEG